MRRIALLLTLLSLAACSHDNGDFRNGRQDEAYIDPGVWEIAETLTGSFANTAQADTTDYEHIHVNSVAIWEDRDEDDEWIYVEQAAADALDQPYRQRVYRISYVTDEHSGNYASQIYTLPGDPLRFAGAWRQDEPLADLSPDDLTLREGCTVYFDRTGPGAYAGRTEGAACASDLRGARYVTSEVTANRRDRFTSWDRGFDADSQQVWGATEGPYIFERIIDED